MKRKQIVSLLLAGNLVLGGTSNAFASANFDSLHKASYDAVMVAQKSKTQADINSARKVVADYKNAIITEGKDSLLVNINTFSELLDKVQHPILVEIVNKILSLKENGTATQADINELRDLIDNLPESLRNAVSTWSSEVDVFQEQIVKVATELVAIAEEKRTQASVENAQVSVSELATAVRESMKKLAEDLQARLDAIEVKEDVTPEKPDNGGDTDNQGNGGDQDNSNGNDGNNNQEKPGNGNGGETTDKPGENGGTEKPDNGGNQGGEEAPDVDENRLIQDDVLNQEIKNLLKISDRELTKEDLKGVYNLKLAGKGIKSLEGLQYCTNLRVLDVGSAYDLNTTVTSYNYIEDITPIIGLSNLERLHLSDNKIKDLNGISNFKNLSMLFLNGADITSLEFIEGLDKLDFLSLYQCTISDASVLDSCTGIESLDLFYVNLSDELIEKCKTLTNLSSLSITLKLGQFTELSDIQKALPNCIVNYTFVK